MFFTLIVFIVILSILVFFHEMGHFLSAKKFGVKAEEFGMGFPPRIGGWKKINGKRKWFWGNAENVESDDTIYSLNWIPIGGFVKIKGENGEDKSDPESFASKPAWQRIIILSAGVFMNVVLTAVFLMGVYMVGAPQIIDDNTTQNIVDPKVQIMQVLPNSPAMQAGLQMGDIIKTVDGVKIEKTAELLNYIDSNENKEINISISRLGEMLDFSVKPEYIESTDDIDLGVAVIDTGVISYPWYQSIWLGIKGTGVMFVNIITAFWLLIKSAFTPETVNMEIAGPVGIAVLTGKVARMGWSYLFQFGALLSMNLAIINFLPFPALDGGRVLFIIIEKIRRKPINQKIEQIVHAVGFFILITLIIVVTGKDIWNFKDSIFGFFSGLIK